MERNNEDRMAEIEKRLFEARSKFFTKKIIDEHKHLQELIDKGAFKSSVRLSMLIRDPKTTNQA